MQPVSVIDSGRFQPTQVSVRISDSRTRIYECTKVLRMLTGRRMTCLASCERKRYVIKVFPRRERSMEEYESEVRGYELLRDAGIDVPHKDYYGQADPDVCIIVYEYLTRWRSLKEVFDQKPVTRTARNGLRRFVSRVAELHRHMLLHEDPHLENFMVRGDRLVVLDAGAVRRIQNEYLLEENFGLFAAQFPMSWRLEQTWVDVYLDTLDKADDKLLQQRLLEQIRFKQQWRERHVLKKIYRECSAFTVRSTLYGRMIIDRKHATDVFVERLSEPSRLFDDTGVEFLKEGHSSTVGVVPIGARQYVIKRYNVKNLLHKIKRIVQESRASKSWRNAHRLILRGIPTAKPIAMFECRKGGLHGVSVFAMEYVKGINSALYFRDPEVSNTRKRSVAKRMVAMLAELERQHLIHGDLKSTNFIIQDDRPVLVDLDAMDEISNGLRRRWAFRREIERFRENWIEVAPVSELFETLLEKMDNHHGET